MKETKAKQARSLDKQLLWYKPWLFANYHASPDSYSLVSLKKNTMLQGLCDLGKEQHLGDKM